MKVLVVEDKRENVEVARSVYHAMEGIEAEFAMTFREGIKRLEEENFDSVVIDLFIPEDSNDSSEAGEQLLKRLQDDHGTIARLEEIVWEGFEELSKEKKEQYRETYRKISQERVEKYSAELKQLNSRLENMKEYPLGLLIAEYCIKQRIPFIMVSEGHRHQGNLAIVRHAVQSDKLGQAAYQADFLPEVLLYRGGDVNKSDPQVWKDALLLEFEGVVGGGLLDPQQREKLEKIFDSFKA